MSKGMDPNMPLYTPEGMLAAAVIDQPDCYQQVQWLSVDLFTGPLTREVYVAIEYVLRDHPAVDSDELVVRTKNVLIEYGRADALNLLVQMVSARTAMGINAPWYAQQVFEARQQADLRAAGVKVSQIVNGDYDIATKRQLLDETWEELSATVIAEPGWRPIEGLTTVAEFMAQDSETYDWVIPGLLERQERLMCIAPEKAGKTVLTRQVALMLAAGRHPFSMSTPVPVMRTLLVDLENPAPSARRDFRRQVEQMEDLWSNDNGSAFILHRPAGIHLGDHKDRLMLTQAVERCKADLLCISPVYKAYDGLGESWEEQAFGIQKPLDMLRDRYNCAIWMEHHPPGKGNGTVREIRPFGSTRWGRWLDYQVALVPEIGDRPPFTTLWWNSVMRDQQKMSPVKLRRGMIGEPSWLPMWEDSEYGFDLAYHEATMG